MTLYVTAPSVDAPTNTSRSRSPLPRVVSTSSNSIARTQHKFAANITFKTTRTVCI